MTAWRVIAAVVRFTVELAALVAVTVWGIRLSGSPLRWLLGLACGAVLATVWGRFVAPKATTRLADPPRLIVEVAVFLAAGAAAMTLAPDALVIAAVVAAITDALLLRALDRRYQLRN